MCSMRFSYDVGGNAVSVNYNGTDYYYVRNAQNDVVKLIDNSGAAVVEYLYDSWGKVISVTGSLATSLGYDQPFMYRGYVYDKEIGLYYLQSRYYDPTICRFISADVLLSTGQGVIGHNAFAYCGNNPINSTDSSGHRASFVHGPSNQCKRLKVGLLKKAKVGNIKKKNLLRKIYGYRRSLPIDGEPNSDDTLYKPDGTPKQKRWYGPDGKAKHDRDYSHGGNEEFPHDHDWVNGEREKEHKPPSPEYECAIPSWVGWGIMLLAVAGAAVVAADDITGVGVSDDVLFAPIIAFFSQGMEIAFGG